jgi:5-(carboxyamino)imidazole ribonucleotide synthase
MKLGILGGGQLGRMMALAAAPLDIHCRVWEPEASACAQHYAEHLHKNYDDKTARESFLKDLDAITYEFENLPAPLIEALQSRTTVYPPALAISTSQDRLQEKAFFQALNIPTAPYRAVNSLAGLEAAVAAIGLPAVLKTCRLGYDGKGQFMLQNSGDITTAWQQLGGGSAPVSLVLEGFIKFRREVSQVAVRSKEGDIRFYAMSENVHRQGILHSSIARPQDAVSLSAQQAVRRLMEALDYVGVICVEFFDLDGKLIANEYAPRVHNSGHWTIEGAETSQFENHVRAVCGLPLGSTATRGHVAMLNIIGTHPDARSVCAIDGAHLHIYGKSEKPGRKLGHITLRADDAATLQNIFEAAQRVMP